MSLVFYSVKSKIFVAFIFPAIIHLSIHNFALFHFVNIFFVVFRWFEVLFLWNLVLHWWSYTEFLRTAILENPRDMGAVLEKQWLFCAQIFLGQNHLVFVYMKYFFVLHQHVFLESKILFVQRQTFYFNTKFHFCFIFLLSHSNKNIITCQKINKLSFLCDPKN